MYSFFWLSGRCPVGNKSEYICIGERRNNITRLSVRAPITLMATSENTKGHTAGSTLRWVLPLALKGGAQSENVSNTAAQEETDGFVRPHRFPFLCVAGPVSKKTFPHFALYIFIDGSTCIHTYIF